MEIRQIKYGKYDYLISSNRFDLMAKYLYVKFFNIKEKTDFYVELYKNHIVTFNNCWEYPGTKTTIKEFVEIAFKVIDIVGFWENESTEIINEKYYYLNKENEKILLVNINPQYYRKCDLNITCGNSSKIKYELGWEPKITFEELVEEMTNEDLKLAKSEIE